MYFCIYVMYAQYKFNLLTRSFIFESQSGIGHSCLSNIKSPAFAKVTHASFLRYRVDSPDLNTMNTSADRPVSGGNLRDGDVRPLHVGIRVKAPSGPNDQS